MQQKIIQQKNAIKRKNKKIRNQKQKIRKTKNNKSI